MKKEISTPKAVAMTIGGGQRSGESSTAASKRGWKRTAIAAVALTSALGIGAAVDGGPKKPVETSQYVFQPGDTAWEVARKVETNTDGIRGNEDVRPIASNIHDQVTNDGDERVMPGDVAQLPVSADVDPVTPGIQLENK